MSSVLRAALTGYNAFTETEPDNFSLYSDEDYILIKEKARGSVVVTAGGSQTIAHGLAYIPMVLVFMERADGTTGTAGRWELLGGDDSNAVCSIEVTTTNLIIRNGGSNSKTAKYYIFYDQQI